LFLATRVHAIGFLLGLGPELVDDGPAFGPRFLTDAAGVCLGLLEKLAVLGLGSLQPLLGLDAVLDLSIDEILARVIALLSGGRTYRLSR